MSFWRSKWTGPCLALSIFGVLLVDTGGISLPHEIGPITAIVTSVRFGLSKYETGFQIYATLRDGRRGSLVYSGADMALRVGQTICVRAASRWLFGGLDLWHLPDSRCSISSQVSLHPAP